jgi:CRISPR-associated endonuclease/helicase Cas3
MIEMTFAKFFHAAWGCDPFPWQITLAEKALRGEWPAAIGLPTAAGKTALIDIALFALAKKAPGSARRIFFVVDRRVIVDEAAERAEKLSKKLRAAAAGSELYGVAQSLLELGGEEPLMTAMLRGGIPRDDGWADSPLQPTVICSTVDQVGSSLLFRAYGTSEYGHPIRAGLAANDSLFILDEAHTASTFAETLSSIRGYRMWAEEPLALPFTVVEMSATPRGDSFHEDDEDRGHPVLKRRWKASKKAKLVSVDAEQDEEASKGGFTALVKAVVREARAMRDERHARVIGVVVNRVSTARSVHALLRADEGCHAILLTGRSRPYDRDRVWHDWKSSIGLGRNTEPEMPIFVVATQCIEVGANLDFDALVTEIASIDALEQRFGRLDRDGKRSAERGATYASIVAQKDQVAKKYEDPVYGTAIPATWAWLTEHLTKEVRTVELPAQPVKKSKTRKVKDEFVEMGVLTLRSALKATEDREMLAMAQQRVPVLMPAHLDLLSQTSPEPPVSPEPSVYLHGPETGPADVQVVWRADIGDSSPDRWIEIVSVCPPSASEAVPVPVWAVRRWLAEQVPGELADIEGQSEEGRRDRAEIRVALDWRGPEESRFVRGAGAIRPGATLVVPASYGGCDEWGWDPSSKTGVDDIGDPVKLRAGRPLLRLHPELAKTWKYPAFAEALRKVEPEDAEAALAEAPDAEADPWVEKAVEQIRSSRKWPFIAEPEKDEWAAIVARASFDQSDARSSYTNEVGLEKHLNSCAGVAEGFARELSPLLGNTVRRAAALHDIGKADPRFQAWLRGGNPIKADELIAKSGKAGQNWAAIRRAREWSGYPEGGRHELTSVALLQEQRNEFGDVDFELLLHLLASHHGRCRPFAPVVVDENPCEVRYGAWTCASNHGLESAGSGVCERFWKLTRRYGWYGLAYLEAVVRLADQRQSEREQKPTAGRGAHA